MRSKIIRFSRSKELIIGFVFLLLLMNSMLVQAAPPLQETPEPKETALVTVEPDKPRETATPAPSNTPESTPEALATATTEPSQTPLPQDQGATPTLESVVGGCAIEGDVFNDLNRNQVRDAGEEALNTTIFLLEAEGENQLDSQETDEDGNDGDFCFEGVSPGSYRVRQEKISGYETIGGQDRFVTVNGLIS